MAVFGRRLNVTARQAPEPANQSIVHPRRDQLLSAGPDVPLLATAGPADQGCQAQQAKTIDPDVPTAVASTLH